MNLSTEELEFKSALQDIQREITQWSMLWAFIGDNQASFSDEEIEQLRQMSMLYSERCDVIHAVLNAAANGNGLAEA
jgi:hypothetical protein